MSLIYRSLKEIKGAKAPSKAGGKAALPRRDVVRVALHTVIGIVVCAIVAVLVWLALGSQVDDMIPPPMAARPAPRPVAAAPAPAPAAPAEAPQPATAPAAQPVPVQPVPQPVPQAVEDLARAITAGMPAAPPADLPKPPKDPERSQAEFYQAQARRNQRVLELERRLSVNWRWDDLSAFRQDLASLRQILGPDSTLAAKWEGVEALADKDYGRAETLMRRNLVRNPTDVSGRMNLLLALIGEGKAPEARQEFGRLARMVPLDPRLKGLAVALARIEQPNATEQGGGQAPAGAGNASASAAGQDNRTK